jgi:predicted RNA-binding protein with PIN domain
VASPQQGPLASGAPGERGLLVAAGRVIVDGMNLIGSRPTGWWRDRPGAMRALVEELVEYARGDDVDVTVVFDGKPIDLPAEGRLRVEFASRRGRDAADDEIARMVAADPDPGSLEVVSSDATLARRARELGAEVVSVSAFRRRLQGFRGP